LQANPAASVDGSPARDSDAAAGAGAPARSLGRSQPVLTSAMAPTTSAIREIRTIVCMELLLST